MYSMDELSTKLNISKQSLYKLIKNNEELSTLVNENSTRINRKIFYGDAVFAWLSRYYNHNGADETNQGVSNVVAGAFSENENANFPQYSPRIAELEAKISVYEEKISDLEARLNEAQEANKQLRQDNGALILTVQQMTNTAFQQYQASVKMLPAPRQPLFKRLKSFFSGQKVDNTAPTDENAPESPK